MFTDISIKNFRCFPSIHFSELARVNLIAGKNNTGKTALLEAIQIHNRPNDIAQAVAIAKFRGIADPNKDISEWAGWLFTGKAGANGFEVSSYDRGGVNRTLSGWLVDSIACREKFPDVERELQGSFRPDIVASQSPRLVFRYEQSKETAVFSSAAWAFGFATVGARINWNMCSTFIGSAPTPVDRDLHHFGELERTKRQDELVVFMQIVEPRLKRLSLVPIGGEPIIHGDIGMPQLVPVQLLGEGLRRLQSLLLAIANSPGGTVLIDEVENGLHHSILKQVWKAIAVAARQNDVQIFATTHSYECIQAAHQAFTDFEPYELRLLRLERRDGGIFLARYDQEMLGTSIDLNWEVR